MATQRKNKRKFWIWTGIIAAVVIVLLGVAVPARGPTPLGAKPLIILTAGKSQAPGLTPEELDAVHKVWVTLHDEMAGLSSRGVNRVVEGSGHYIHQEQPQVVVDAVFEALDAVRH